MMPISSTKPISALRPGLAKNAWMICRYSPTMTSVHAIRNTTIRTRKIRGEDSLFSSISIAERDEGPAGILASMRNNLAEHYGTAAAGKKLVRSNHGRGGRNLGLKPGFHTPVFELLTFLTPYRSRFRYDHFVS